MEQWKKDRLALLIKKAVNHAIHTGGYFAEDETQILQLLKEWEQEPLVEEEDPVPPSPPFDYTCPHCKATHHYNGYSSLSSAIGCSNCGEWIEGWTMQSYPKEEIVKMYYELLYKIDKE